MKINAKENIGIWELVGFAFTSLAGTLLHFLYDLTGSRAAALFSGVNESTWEHMKLLFFPMLLFAIFQSFFLGKEYSNFWCVKLGGTLAGLAAIPIIFYTLRGIFGTTPDWINIAIFFVSAAIGFIFESSRFKNEGKPCRQWVAIAVLVLIAIAFWVFTFFPPALPLFQDPIDGSLGIR